MKKDLAFMVNAAFTVLVICFTVCFYGWVRRGGCKIQEDYPGRALMILLFPTSVPCRISQKGTLMNLRYSSGSFRRCVVALSRVAASIPGE
jgi:hypothetical protein